MPAYLISRLFLAVWVIFGVASLVFFLIHWIPGDPIEVMLGESASSADQQALRHALGLDRPLAQQWWSFISGVAHLDFGQSIYNRQPVIMLLDARFGATLQLAAVALLFAVALALPLGIVAAANLRLLGISGP